MTPAERAEFRRSWIGFAAMTGGVFMAFLDIQVVASSLTQIQAGLGATRQEMAWVQTAYLIAEVIAIPLSGYLSRLLSTRVYFTISALGFTLASAACAMAWNIESMMVFRALQGFLGGGMIPSSFAALYLMFPIEQRVWPQVIMGVTATAAPTLGPVVGGWVTGAWSWHWLFLVNLAPGLLIAIAVWHLVHVDKPQPELWKTLDVQGAVAMALFLGSLEWVLEEGPMKGWLESGAIRFWGSVCVVSGVFFFARMFTYAHPILTLRLFRDRNFVLANMAAMILSIPLFGLNYIIPLFLGGVRGFDSMQIGNTLVYSGVAMMLIAPFAGRLARTVDLRLLFVIGCLVMGASIWEMAHLTIDSGPEQFAWPMAMRGIGAMLALMCCSSISLTTVPTESLKDGSAMYSLVRNLGGALGLAAINSVMQYRTATHDQQLVEALRLSRAPVRDALAAGDGSLLWYAELAHRVQQQAAILTYNDALLILLASVILASPILVFARRTRIRSEEPVLQEV